MEKEKQIEEMAKFINGSKCPTEKCPKMDKEQEKAFGPCNIHRAQILYDAGYGNVKEAVKEALQKEQEKEIKKQEAFARAMGFAPDASPYYIARKYKEKFEYAMKELAEARKETFMEIMEMLRFGYELPIDDIAREMAKEYGVEVEE